MQYKAETIRGGYWTRRQNLIKEIRPVEGGRRFYKEAPTLESANFQQQIYERLKAANLPVPIFFKIEQESDESGKTRTFTVTDDLTEDGKFILLSPEDADVNTSTVPIALRDEVIKSIATTYNIGLNKVHGSVYLFRFPKPHLKYDPLLAKDFKIIDYDNFEIIDSEDSNNPRIISNRSAVLEGMCRKLADKDTEGEEIERLLKLFESQLAR